MSRCSRLSLPHCDVRRRGSRLALSPGGVPETQMSIQTLAGEVGPWLPEAATLQRRRRAAARTSRRRRSRSGRATPPGAETRGRCRAASRGAERAARGESPFCAASDRSTSPSVCGEFRPADQADAARRFAAVEPLVGYTSSHKPSALDETRGAVSREESVWSVESGYFGCRTQAAKSRDICSMSIRPVRYHSPAQFTAPSSRRRTESGEMCRSIRPASWTSLTRSRHSRS
jgi:hypothetical protein